MSDFTDLRDRLDRLADAHVRDLEPVVVPTEIGRAPNPWPARIAAAAVVTALAIGAWVLFEQAADEESPADDGSDVQTLGEPELALPGWTRLPITDLADLDPEIQSMIGSGDGLDLTTLRVVDTDGLERFVALTADHTAVWFAVRTEGGMSSTQGSLRQLLHDSMVVWIGYAYGEGEPTQQLGLVPSRIERVEIGEASNNVEGGLLDITYYPEPDSPHFVTTPDGLPITMVDTVGPEGSSIVGEVAVRDEPFAIDIPVALCLATPDGLLVNARRTDEAGVFIAVNHTPPGTNVQVITEDAFVWGTAKDDAQTVVTTADHQVTITLDSEDLTGEIVVQCVNPPSLDQLVAAMRGE